MTRKFQQYRYPEMDGEIFYGNNSPLPKNIKQLGIQSIPGLTFYVNNDKTKPIILGYSGIFDLDLSDIPLAINSILFDRESFKLLENEPTGYLILDLVWEED